MLTIISPPTVPVTKLVLTAESRITARVEDNTVICGHAIIRDNARISGDARVLEMAQEKLK